MANDSNLFRDHTTLEDNGAYPVGGNCWKQGDASFLPLYEGKMVQAYDHRAADIVLADGNLFRTGQGRDLTAQEHGDPARCALPRYWGDASKVDWAAPTAWGLAIKDVTSVTNTRTTIATLIPQIGAGHTLPLIFPEQKDDPSYRVTAVAFLANLNSVVLDYLARQKVHGNHLAWYLIEQLPVVPLERYDSIRFGEKTAGEIATRMRILICRTPPSLRPDAVPNLLSRPTWRDASPNFGAFFRCVRLHDGNDPVFDRR
jgi:hypothetical protein